MEVNKNSSRLFRPWIESSVEQPKNIIPNTVPALSSHPVHCPRKSSEYSSNVPVARIEPLRSSPDHCRLVLDKTDDSIRTSEEDQRLIPETEPSRSYTPHSSFSDGTCCRSNPQDHDRSIASPPPSSENTFSTTTSLTDGSGFLESPVKPTSTSFPKMLPHTMIENSAEFYSSLTENPVIPSHYFHPSALAGHSSTPVSNLLPPLTPDLLTWSTLRVLMEEEQRKCSSRRRREKKFACPKCSMTFSNKGQLTGHYRKHTGERPYKCQSCGKRFTRNEELTRHTRIHTGDRPFACNLCSKRFGRKDHLNKHQRTHTAQIISSSSSSQQHQLQVMLLSGASAGVSCPPPFWSALTSATSTLTNV